MDQDTRSRFKIQLYSLYATDIVSCFFQGENCMYRVLLVYMLTSIYAGLEILENLEQFTSIYADKMVRRRRKK